MKIGKLQVTMPWNNLGCFGVRWGTTYADVFVEPFFGFYINDKITRRRYKLPTFKLVNVQVLDPENAARIFRRTMQPYVVLYDYTHKASVEVMSYPYVKDATVKLMVRTTPADATTLVERHAANLRPIDFRIGSTGIPANDPIERQHINT